MPAAIPEPDRRPPLTAHTQQAHTTTPPPTNRNNTAAQIGQQITPHRSQQHRNSSHKKKFAGKIKKYKVLLDNAPEVGHNKDAATNKPRTSWETGNQWKPN